MKYAFITGKNPKLTIAELGAILGSAFKKSEPNKPHDVVFFEGDLPAASPQAFLNRLGGTLEILEVFAEKISTGELETHLLSFLQNKACGKTGKFSFALNLLPENPRSRVLPYLLPKLKKALRAEGIHANFLNNNFRNADPVALVKQNVLAKGASISIIDEGNGKISLGSTMALQDFESYSKRDYGKPFRDPQAGMLPPKLAQIMVNLATLSSCQLIYDPFCGSGTILMEAALMGFNVAGSDADARMVEGTKKNLDWLFTLPRFPLRSHSNPKLFQKNATALAAEDFPQEKFAIVTEPFLGPPLSDLPAPAFLQKLMKELASLYLNFFKNLSGKIPRGTVIVFIFPYWKRKNAPPQSSKTRLSEQLLDEIKELGYHTTPFYPFMETSLFYERPDQVVGREIIRFEFL